MCAKRSINTYITIKETFFLTLKKYHDFHCAYCEEMFFKQV